MLTWKLLCEVVRVHGRKLEKHKRIHKSRGQMHGNLKKSRVDLCVDLCVSRHEVAEVTANSRCDIRRGLKRCTVVHFRTSRESFLPDTCKVYVWLHYFVLTRSYFSSCSHSIFLPRLCFFCCFITCSSNCRMHLLFLSPMSCFLEPEELYVCPHEIYQVISKHYW